MMILGGGVSGLQKKRYQNNELNAAVSIEQNKTVKPELKLFGSSQSLVF
jgi:hypothetical protein